jgi:signal transduction histidine kinase
LKNAVESMPSGGSISFEWSADEEMAVLQVADTGPGLPPHISAAIAGNTTIESTKRGGNGIGLMSVRDVLRRFGGGLAHVPSTEGTVWALRLPRMNREPNQEPK